MAPLQLLSNALINRDAVVLVTTELARHAWNADRSEFNVAINIRIAMSNQQCAQLACNLVFLYEPSAAALDYVRGTQLRRVRAALDSGVDATPDDFKIDAAQQAECKRITDAQ